jgi:hypothetical protein
MSKQKALDELSERAELLMLEDLPPRTVSGDCREDTVKAWQQDHGLKPDGWPGSKTLATLWMRHKPTAKDVVEAARFALGWPPVAYSMTRNTGMGESWLPDMRVGYETGDCSDFACHCLGIPKDQTNGRVTMRAALASVWLGADAIYGGHIGKVLPLAEARPGDLIVYGGKWERGERVAVGHVEVCVAIEDGNIITIGCASSNHKHNAKRSAIAMRDKTDRWRRKGAVAVRPWWYA